MQLHHWLSDQPGYPCGRRTAHNGASQDGPIAIDDLARETNSEAQSLLPQVLAAAFFKAFGRSTLEMPCDAPFETRLTTLK